MSKYLDREIKNYECVKCGWKQKIWNYQVSQTRCSCGGKSLKNWKMIDDAKVELNGKESKNEDR